MDPTRPFTAHHIRFEVETLTPLLLPACAGPSIRGALFGALRSHFCPLSDGETPTGEHSAACPVCWLMATENEQNKRGRDVPRPYTIEPPLLEESPEGQTVWFDPGERFCFGVTLFAQAVDLFPYLVLAIPLIGQTGLGIPLHENGTHTSQKRRGQFRVCRVEAVNPVSGECTTVMGAGETTVHIPDMPATEHDVTALSQALLETTKAQGELEICFRTPTRIVEGEHLVKRPWMGPLFRRLLERLDALRVAYAGYVPVQDRDRLEALADSVTLVADGTQWTEVRSTSKRLGRSTWVSGYTGSATYRADAAVWQELLPYLLWGQVTHVGKNATKGNGWLEIGGHTWPSSVT